MGPLLQNNLTGVVDDAMSLPAATMGDESAVAEEESISTTAAKKHLPKYNRVYAEHQYWEERFREESDFDWLMSYEQLSDQIRRHLTSSSRILIIGCGNAPFSADLYDDGYHNIVNIDYAASVIQRMQQRHGEERPEMEWLEMDMTDLQFDNESFDVVIDKATMDAIMVREGDVWNPDQDVVAMARECCLEIARVLRPFGVFLQASLAQPHFRKKYLLGWHGSEGKQEDDTHSPEFGWSLAFDPAGKDAEQSAFHHFLYTMVKDMSSDDS